MTRQWICATAVRPPGDDAAWHPAIRMDKLVMYWPNVTLATAQEARARAKQTLDWVDVTMREWNVWLAPDDWREG